MTDEHNIMCGCGDFGVTVTDYYAIQALDVLCPECDNHFGFDNTGDAE